MAWSTIEDKRCVKMGDAYVVLNLEGFGSETKFESIQEEANDSQSIFGLRTDLMPRECVIYGTHAALEEESHPKGWSLNFNIFCR